MEITATSKDAYKLMHEGILAFARAEQQGMRIDVNYCKKQSRILSKKILDADAELMQSDFVKEWRKLYGKKFNLNSPTQLAKLLYSHMGIEPPMRTASGGGSTSEEALGMLDIPELKPYLEIRQMRKLRDTYLGNFIREQVDGFMHPFFNLHTVRTFRSSSNAPNFQNIPKRDKKAMKLTRSAIFPRIGHQLMELDFSKLEVSIAACYHKDPTMMDYLCSSHNDMHGDLAQQIFKISNFDINRDDHDTLRNAAKNGFIFPQFYGDYYGNNAAGLAQWTSLPHTTWKKGMGIAYADAHISDHMIFKGIKSFNHFVKHLKEIEDDFWNNRFKDYGKWKIRWIKDYQKKGYIDLLTGFRISGVMGKNNVINYPVQGAAFHCLLWTFIEVDKWLRENNMDSKLIGQIHDAVILDVHPDELEAVAYNVKRIATVELPKAWRWIIAPLQIDAELCPVDGSFAQKEKYKLPNVA